MIWMIGCAQLEEMERPMTSDDHSGHGPGRPRIIQAQASDADELESVFATITDALFVYDLGGRLIRINDAARQLLGLDPDDHDYANLSPSERAARAGLRTGDGTLLPADEWVLTRLLRGEVITSSAAVDVSLERPDGSHLLAAFTGAPMRDSAGAIIGAVAVGRDVTEQRRLEGDLREANTQLAAATATLTQQASKLDLTNRRMDQFLGMANHEMKSPLTALSANLQLALRRLRRLARSEDRAAPEHADAAQAPQVEQEATALTAVIAMLTRAQSATRRMTRLVNELLDVSRIQTGRMEARLEPCDLLALTRAVIAEQQQTQPGRVIRLETACAAAPVLADPDRISEVIDNYLSNALKYSPADSPIIVSLAACDDGAVRVCVCDKGQGIAPETQARIWNVFERLDSGGAQRAQGVNLGLGLHICKTIIALHGGNVGVESAVGAGSTFWFTLPLAAPETSG
jgi:signal transduction histidine kinase